MSSLAAAESEPVSRLASLPLSPTERLICQILARHFGKFIPNQRIVDFVYAAHSDGGPESAARVIDVTMTRLRPKLAEIGLKIEGATGSRRMLNGPVIKAAMPAPVSVAPAGAMAAATTVVSTPLPAAAGTPALGSDAIHLGDTETGKPVGIDLDKLIAGRLLIQGASGAGKSWTMRRLLEQTSGRIQQIVIDPEGEFVSLAEATGLLRVDARQLDRIALALLAQRARAHRTSLHIDLSDLDREAQMIMVQALLAALIGAAPEHWNPALVAIDEAHLFAPYGDTSSAPSVRKASVAAVVDLMSRGRKRGLAGVLATQRLARLSKSVVSEAGNLLIGQNNLDLDIRRAAEAIGWDTRRAFDRLPLLPPGGFVAAGPAFSVSPTLLTIGPVRTLHGGATPEVSAPPTIDAEAAAALLDVAALVQASAEERASTIEDRLPVGARAVRDLLRDPLFPLVGRIIAALRDIAPDGALIGDLAAAIGESGEAIAEALALIDRFAALDFMGEGAARAVRLGRDMLP